MNSTKHQRVRVNFIFVFAYDFLIPRKYKNNKDI